jgi:hypothetical protein
MSGIITNGMQPFVLQTAYTSDELYWNQCKLRGHTDSECLEAILAFHDQYMEWCCNDHPLRRCVQSMKSELVQDFMPPFQTDAEVWQQCKTRPQKGYNTHKSCKVALRCHHNEFIKYCDKVIFSPDECSKRLQEEIVKGFKSD